MKLATYGVSNMIDVAVGELVDLGVADGKIGVDPGTVRQRPTRPRHAHRIRIPRPVQGPAGADIQNGVALLDDVILLKDEAEIERLRLATAAGRLRLRLRACRHQTRRHGKPHRGRHRKGDPR